MTIDEWFAEKDAPFAATPSRWDRTIWESAQAEILKDQERLVRAVFAAGFRCGQYHPHRQDVLGLPNSVLAEDVYLDYKAKDIHSPEAWEKVP